MTAPKAGGAKEDGYAHRIHAWVPVAQLENLASHPSVRRIRQPFRPFEDAVGGEGVRATNASAWLAAGVDGAGVKVAIVDSGFRDYEVRQRNRDLPTSVKTADYCGGRLKTASEHGTVVAEIVHEMAPGAELHLVCIRTEVSLMRALQYVVRNGISVANHSASWFNTSRGDGSGDPTSPDAIVAEARSKGILWVNSAGNRAAQHWTGEFTDPDGNGWHNFDVLDEANDFVIPANAVVCGFVRWDQWPVSTQDYDLYLFRVPDLTVLGVSDDDQVGEEQPTEGLCYRNDLGVNQRVGFGILKADKHGLSIYRSDESRRFDLFTTGGSLRYRVATSSITEPGSSPSAFAVGAVCWQDSSLQPYSSRGPTIDGRIKPDVAGPDSTSSASYGAFKDKMCGRSGFPGTSASSPHVAGAAALVRQANPTFGPAEIQSFLMRRAIDQGPPGPDNGFGSGRLDLGMPPAASSGPSAADAPPARRSALPSQ
ncbi:MAG: S8 family serine peptidase [Chloroflexi bacterium]|nr:S8 family serine peptidase [Chloroflexota bacterium]